VSRRGWIAAAAVAVAAAVATGWWWARPDSPPPAGTVLVPAGVFAMGSADGDEDERPVRAIRLDAFAIDRHEVSNAQYALCVGEGACRPPSVAGSETRLGYFDDPQYAGYPVLGVTWDDASRYCEWRGARLPTEAEWEKAARGTDERTYPWGDEFDPARLNYCDGNCPLPWADIDHDDAFLDTAPVDAFGAGASPYGALNMAGNVWEWVADRYAADAYASSQDENPRGPPAGEQRVTRGGGIFNDAAAARTTSRRRFSPDVPSTSVGFRCALTP
jgi:serine/threonine-protein kinase